MLAESLCCVLEQDTFHCLVLVQPRKTCPDMTEKLLKNQHKKAKHMKQHIGDCPHEPFSFINNWVWLEVYMRLWLV